ncbi:hypothetical protein V8E36_000588 [Tilletia maclaganii]
MTSSSSYEFWQLPDVPERKGWDSLTKQTGTIPEPGPKEVLVKIHASSLNYRDLTISRNEYPLYLKPGTIIPGSDCAGEVVKLGPGASLWKQGDRVSAIFNRDHLFGPSPDEESSKTGFGGGLDGFLTQYQVVPEIALVPIPEYLSYEEAATLPCAAVTAWNGLYGVLSEQLGTGGVSVFALQLALAAGANVIATSSNKAKLDKVLHSVSAEQRQRVKFINYKETKEWGKEAVKLNGGKPVDFMIPHANQPRDRRRRNRRAGDKIPHVPYLALSKGALFRGTLIGSRQLFLDMLRTFETHKIKPVIDRVFDFNELPEAYEYLWSGSHVGKVVVKIP